MEYTYDGCCGSCVYMNTNDYVGHKDHCCCTYRRQYYNLKDSKCSYYRFDPNKDYYDLNHRWHVVTSILQILGSPAKSLEVKALHDFRMDVLEKDDRYSNVLQVYDVVGPFLANQLLHDQNAFLISSLLMEHWLKPINQHVEASKYDEAIHQYARMIDFMGHYYESQFLDYCALKKIQPASLQMEGCL